MLALMFRSRARKMRRMQRAAGKEQKYPQSMRRVPDEELFDQSQGLAINGTQVMGLSGIRPRTVVQKTT
jgi:hypothetical protein